MTYTTKYCLSCGKYGHTASQCEQPRCEECGKPKAKADTCSHVSCKHRHPWGRRTQPDGKTPTYFEE